MAPTPHGCRGCGGPLPPQRYQGNPRQWCGEPCRLRTHRQRMAPPCPGCGRPTTGERCAACVAAAATTPAAAERRRALRRAGKARRREAARACHCGTPLPAGRRACDPCRHAVRQGAWQRKNATRRGAAAMGPVLSVERLGERDGWVCHLCLGAVDRTLPYLDVMAGTRDHLVPVSRGGDDSPANLALAHRSCNSRRGARPLVGV